MHRYIATIAKVLAVSMVLMFIFDAVLNIVEVISIHSRMSAVMGTLQTEVARNNFMPDALGASYLDYFTQIAEDSSLMDATDVHTNFTSNLRVNGVTYTALTAANAGEYGEIITIAVHIDVHPLFFNRELLDIGLDYVYSVPCLRYLK